MPCCCSRCACERETGSRSSLVGALKALLLVGELVLVSLSMLTALFELVSTAACAVSGIQTGL